MEIITTSSTSTAGEACAPTASPRPPAWSGGAPLPARPRRVLEQLSGYDLSGVRVYADSPWPAHLGARAFVFGLDVHLSPEAEDALGHGAWHVVQQKQGRVRATGTASFDEHPLGVVGLNDEEALEREADMLGLLARGLVPRGAVPPMTGGAVYRAPPPSRRPAAGDHQRRREHGLLLLSSRARFEISAQRQAEAVASVWHEPDHPDSERPRYREGAGRLSSGMRAVRTAGPRQDRPGIEAVAGDARRTAIAASMAWERRARGRIWPGRGAAPRPWAAIPKRANRRTG